MSRWRCEVCGYVHEGEAPPDVCPICGVGPEQFTRLDEAPAPADTGSGLHIVVVGNGVAGHHAALAARRVAPEARVTLLAAEGEHFYNRLGLTPYIAGQLSRASLSTVSAQSYTDKDVEVRLGQAVTRLDRARKTLLTAGGAEIRWDRLVLCAGAQPFVPPVPGLELPSVRRLRSLTDADELVAHAADWKRVLVVGGGLLGLEAAYALRQRGSGEVLVVERAPRLLPRQLDEDAATLLLDRVRQAGLEVRTNAVLEQVEPRDDGGFLARIDGQTESVDAVLVSVGIQPELTLARAAGLATGRGVLVDDRMATSDPAVFAAGDIAEHRGVVWGLWPIAMQMGSTAGANAAGGDEELRDLTAATFLKVLGVPVFSVGLAAEPPEGATSLVLRDADKGHYTKLVVHQGRVVGAILMGDASRTMAVRNAVEQHAPTGDVELKGDPAVAIDRLLDGF